MTVVDDYQAQTETLAVDSQAQVLAVYTALLAGQISREDATLLIAGIINRANAVAVSLADVFLAGQIEEISGVATPTVGIAPRDDSSRLIKAIDTILDEDPTDVGEQFTDVPDDSVEPAQSTGGLRITRLARAEPLDTAQQSTMDAMQHQPLVEGWTRQMDADPCTLCTWWSREGRIWPKEHPFQSHKGCNCQPKIVVAEHIESTGFTRKLERNRAS